MATKEEHIKGIADIIASEQCSRLPHEDAGSGMFVVRGALPYTLIRAIAEQIYHRGYSK